MNGQRLTFRLRHVEQIGQIWEAIAVDECILGQFEFSDLGRVQKEGVDGGRGELGEFGTVNLE